MRTGGHRTAGTSHQLTDSDVSGGIDFVGSEEGWGFGLFDDQLDQQVRFFRSDGEIDQKVFHGLRIPQIYQEKGANCMNMQPILASCEEAIDNLGVKYFAIKWGHKRQYIEKIIDPEPDPEGRRNFPLQYFVDVLAETRDMRHLEAIAKQFGKMVVDAPCGCESLTPENAREILAEAQVKMGAVLNKLHTALKDYKLSRSELVELFESSYEAFNAVSRFGFGADKAAKGLE